MSDRPVSRSAYKLLLRVLRGSSHSHSYDWLPWLKISESDSARSSLFYKNERVIDLVPFDRLCEMAPSEVFVIGSGPSVLHCEVEKLPSASAILLNGAAFLCGDKIVTPLAVAIEDERFIYRHFTVLKQRLPKEAVFMLSVGVLRAICELDAQWLRDRTVILIDNILKPAHSRRRKLSDFDGEDFVRVDPLRRAGFSLDPRIGVFQAGSVAVSAFQMALACKPRLVGFMGVDIHNASTPRFYEKTGEAAFSGVQGAEARILSHFALGVEVSKEYGVDLAIFSPDSALSKCGITYDRRFFKAQQASVVE